MPKEEAALSGWSGLVFAVGCLASWRVLRWPFLGYAARHGEWSIAGSPRCFAGFALALGMARLCFLFAHLSTHELHAEENCSVSLALCIAFVLSSSSPEVYSGFRISCGCLRICCVGPGANRCSLRIAFRGLCTGAPVPLTLCQTLP